MVKKIVLWILVISCMVMIFSFSAQESSESGDLSRSFISTILKFFNIKVEYDTLEILDFATRKLAHFSVYALLGFLIYLLMKVAYSITTWKSVILSPVFSALYAATDEFHQLFVSGRSGRIQDVFIDFSGAVFGMAVGWVAIQIVGRIKNG
ncbi:MAG: VanZ family protein [Clostridia bacterium]